MCTNGRRRITTGGPLYTGSFLRVWPHLLKKSLMENFIFCEVQWFRSVFQWFRSVFQFQSNEHKICISVSPGVHFLQSALFAECTFCKNSSYMTAFILKIISPMSIYKRFCMCLKNFRIFASYIYIYKKKIRAT